MCTYLIPTKVHSKKKRHHYSGTSTIWSASTLLRSRLSALLSAKLTELPSLEVFLLSPSSVPLRESCSKRLIVLALFGNDHLDEEGLRVLCGRDMLGVLRRTVVFGDKTVKASSSSTCFAFASSRCHFYSHRQALIGRLVRILDLAYCSSHPQQITSAAMARW